MVNYLIYNDDLSFEECFPETFSNLEDIESNNVLVIDEKLYSYLQNLTTDFKLKENFELKELYTIEDKDIFEIIPFEYEKPKPTRTDLLEQQNAFLIKESLEKDIQIKELNMNLAQATLESINKDIEINKESHITIKNKSNTYKIYLNEIKYIEVQKKNMIIHTINKDFDVIYSLEKIEKDLKLDKFVRCHKSFLVNLSYVENIKLNTAILESGEEVPVSRYRYKEVKERFLKFLGDSIC